MILTCTSRFNKLYAPDDSANVLQCAAIDVECVARTRREELLPVGLPLRSKVGETCHSVLVKEFQVASRSLYPQHIPDYANFCYAD
jgi:hypothetical protein